MTAMPSLRLSTLLVAILFSAIGCGAPARAQTIVVMVNGEPITNMDIEQRTKLTFMTTHKQPNRQEVINELIVTCVDMVGATALSITHDMHSLREIGDNAAMIYQGKIIWSGAAKDIDNSGNPYVEQFIHGSAQGPIQMEVLRP